MNKRDKLYAFIALVALWLNGAALSADAVTLAPRTPRRIASSQTDAPAIAKESPPTAAPSNEADTQSPYCAPELCEIYNGSHVVHVRHVACHNNGSFAQRCGAQPFLLPMTERRRQLILDLHNLARSRIASGQVVGYRPAAHMPVLKWDNELAHLSALHVKRCQFAHDRCRNSPQYPLSGQNIGYFWISRAFKSHSKRIKSFVVNWYREYADANQTFIDSYMPHPEGKKIGHFTMLAADRAHRVGCAAIRFREPGQLQLVKFLLTCNYDYTNIIGEPVYRSGAAASACPYKASEHFPALCDWQRAVYDYGPSASGRSLDDDDDDATASARL